MHIRRTTTLLAVTLVAAAAGCTGADRTILAPEGAEPLQNHVPACMDFNVPALGAAFGGPFGTPPGVAQWVENGIRVAVRPFDTGAGIFYAEARIVFPPVAFGAGKTGRARSINWEFDFSGLPFVPSMVSFEWLDQGNPIENLGVNGSPHYIGQLHAPPAAFGPIQVGSAWGPAPGGLTGQIRLVGPVKRVVVGGQPVWIDHVCAYP